MLRDKELLSILQREGFVRFPFINEIKVNQLCELFGRYDKFHNAEGKFYHSTFNVGIERLSVKIDSEIQEIIKDSMRECFINYEPIVANFLIKECVEHSELPPHQDWTFVDESKFQSANIWIPLQDVDAQNGCLTFLPKSHLIYSSYRPSPNYPSIFEKVMPLAKKKMTPISVKAGEAVVFYHSVLHGSTANKTNRRRLSIVQGIYSKGAQLEHLFIDEDTNVISLYNIAVKDYYKMEYLKRPVFIKPTIEFCSTFPQLTEKQFLEYYPTSALQKIKQWILS